MSSIFPRPDEQEPPSGLPVAPETSGEPLRPDASVPATASDLCRFPERGETSRVTSYLNPDTPEANAVAPPAGPQAPGGSGESGGGQASPGLLPDFDPQIEIERRLGVGGMGEVFLGLQKHLGRKVAVKRIRDWGEDAQNKARFIHEAKAQSVLRHPGIAQVYDFREADGSLYLIMEYVEGETLEELLEREGKLPPDRILRIGVQLSEALESAAHDGYIHRDLKPGNVMLTEAGRIKIIDFGLALRFRSLMRTRFTQKGEILGTPAYLSPEQLNEEEHLDVRSDLWSLGVLLYALATGAPPFTGKDFVCTVKNVMMSEPIPLPTIEPGFPPALWEVLRRALRRDRSERWQDYPSFREALLGCVGASRAASPGEPAPKAPGVLLGIFALIGVGALAAILSGILFSSPSNVGREKSNAAPREWSNVPAQRELRDKIAPSEVAPARKEPPPGGKAAGEENAQGREAAVSPKPDTPAKSATPELPLRERLALYPLSAEGKVVVTRILDLLSKHREELLGRDYDSLLRDLETLRASKLEPYLDAQVEAALDLGRLARELVRDRGRELSESKVELRLLLEGGQTAQGTVESRDSLGITLASAGGGKTRVLFATLAPEEFQRAPTVPLVEVAFGALSGNAGKALGLAQELEKVNEKVALSYPVLLRLARLNACEEIRATITQAEAPLSRKEPRQAFLNSLTHYPRATEILRALSGAEADVCRIYPFLEKEFKEARREGEALELLLDGAFAQVLAEKPGTEAEKVAATQLLAEFLFKLEPAHDDLMANLGWLNYNWELRPDLPTIPERLKFWDRLDGGGCVLRDPGGPRSLIMGRPHPRVSEGVVLQFEFEPLGASPESAEWRFNLRREGGGQSYLRFDGGSVSLRTSTLGGAAADETLMQAKFPEGIQGKASHTCALVPGVQLLVYLDGVLLAALKKEDALLPSQPSLVVRGGKLSVRSIQVLKKPSK